MISPETNLFLWKKSKLLFTIALSIILFIFFIVLPYNNIPLSTLSFFDWLMFVYVLVARFIVCPFFIAYYTKKCIRSHLATKQNC